MMAIVKPHIEPMQTRAQQQSQYELMYPRECA